MSVDLLDSTLNVDDECDTPARRAFQAEDKRAPYFERLLLLSFIFLAAILLLSSVGTSLKPVWASFASQMRLALLEAAVQ